LLIGFFAIASVDRSHGMGGGVGVSFTFPVLHEFNYLSFLAHKHIFN
jgi:hypothetical protein